MQVTRQTIVVFATITLAIFASVRSAPAALTDNLQAYWSFNGNGDDQVGSVDLVANSDTGSTISYASGLVGQAVSVPHKVGSVGSFMGTDGAAGSDYNVVKDMTVSIWYKQTAALPASGNVFHFAQVAYPDFAIYTRNPDGAGYALVNGAGAGSTIAGGFEAADVWQHRVVRISYNSGTNKTTIEQWYARATDADHVTYDNQAIRGDTVVVDSSKQLKIGFNTSTNSDLLYDEVGVWNRSLSNSEIEELFDLGKAGTPILVPEPASFGLVSVALAGLAAVRRRRRPSGATT